MRVIESIRIWWRCRYERDDERTARTLFISIYRKNGCAHIWTWRLGSCTKFIYLFNLSAIVLGLLLFSLFAEWMKSNENDEKKQNERTTTTKKNEEKSQLMDKKRFVSSWHRSEGFQTSTKSNDCRLFIWLPIKVKGVCNNSTETVV